MCYSVIMSFCSHYRRIRYLSMSVSGVFRSNMDHHKQMVKLIGERDLEAVIKTLKTHLRKLNIEKDSILDQYSDYFEDLIDEKELFQDFNK
jgi:DNA-binding GntR family transcriptional regulator